ncbi:hypothetical protein [Emticicia sp. SJ17W-69]|uniref:hypothetical protein n=1 Tax=Emticicia sp. SJ17W-69 TaxID=3421657 RepID=UPI003EBDFF31
MSSSRPEYLMDKLIKNTLTKDELEELLAGIGENEMSSDYSEILERFFKQLLIENSVKKDLFQ